MEELYRAMIYFDNAATTYPKPYNVIKQTLRAFEIYGANPGRSGHFFANETAEAVFKARNKCAALFNAEVENTCFTLNCTHALNLAIKGIITENAHLITTDLEHNSVIRPIHSASRKGCTYSIAKVEKNDLNTVKNIEELITPKTKAVICTCASNVTGQILPIKLIADLCKRKNICFIVDAAQGAGIIDLNIKEGINILCCAGHKGLYGPMGTGLLISDGKFHLKTIIEGGTGSDSNSIEQPIFTPDKFESGTINTPGVIALGAGIDFISKKGIAKIHKEESRLCNIFINELKNNNNITLYIDENIKTVPLISFNIKGISSFEAATLLSDSGFCLRGGLHCSFLAHNKLGTIEQGTVRFAPSIFNKPAEVYMLTDFLNNYTKKLK